MTELHKIFFTNQSNFAEQLSYNKVQGDFKQYVSEFSRIKRKFENFEKLKRY